MLTDRINNRWQAFAVHLVISVIIFIALAYLIYRWYPGVLFQYDGGLEGIQLIAGVDLVIGPLLTLLVFNRAKKSLKMDLTIIGALQILCLVGGMWTVYQTRPVAVVYADGAFRSFPYQYFQDAKVDIRQQKLLQGEWPVWVYVEGREAAVPMGAVNDATFMQVEKYQLIDQAFSKRIVQYGKKPEQLSWVPQMNGVAVTEEQNLYPAGLGIGSGWLQWNNTLAEAEQFFAEASRQTALDKLLGLMPKR